jgi:hypothetical protein
LFRQRTEQFNSPIDRGLTARPVVLAKTFEPGSSYPAGSDDPGRTFSLQAMKIVEERRFSAA